MRGPRTGHERRFDWIAPIIPSSRSRRSSGIPSLARGFIAKAVWDLPTARHLIDRLKVDPTLRRLCGWSRVVEVPSEATFSRAFAEFSRSRLPERMHEALVEEALGDALRVRVTFTDNAGMEETLVSVATAPVNTPATGLPAITGTARVGETLTASVSDNADADGLEGAEFAYRWISNDGDADTDIEDATKASYTLTAAETGKAIRVRVTFTDDGFMEETLTSEATATVEAAVAEANAGPAAGETVLWSADMEVIDYGAGSTGGASADLFSNIGGSGGLRAQWLRHYAPDRKPHLSFAGTALCDIEDVVLHMGGMALPFASARGRYYTFTWSGVDVDWEDGQMVAVRIARAVCCFAEKTVPIGPFLFRLNRGRTAEKSG